MVRGLYLFLVLESTISKSQSAERIQRVSFEAENLAPEVQTPILANVKIEDQLEGDNLDFNTYETSLLKKSILLKLPTF